MMKWIFVAEFVTSPESDNGGPTGVAKAKNSWQGRGGAEVMIGAQ